MAISEEKKSWRFNDFGTFLFTKILCASCTGFCFGYQVQKVARKKNTQVEML
jgi:hypothetical protein